MERFRGQVLRLGQVVLEDVAGLLKQHTGPDGAPLWCGDFEVPFGYCLGRGEYELVLDDGRSGRILITYISSDSHRCRVARFEAPAGLRERGTAPLST
jgi:hypothetical protein